MITEWFCVRCSATGRVRHAGNAGVWEVYRRIVDAHAEKAHRLTGCDTDSNKIRVTIPKGKLEPPDA